MRILFYDVATPYLYTNETLSQAAIGGTEATVTRVARGLQATHSVYVAQHCRHQDAECEEYGVNYISFATAHAHGKNNFFDVVILLRDQEYLKETGEHFNGAKLFFWMHNTPARNLIDYKPLLLKYNYQIIAVSHYHRKLIEKRLAGKLHQRLLSYISATPTVKVQVVYNPIADNLSPDQTPYQANKLLFLSSPQKGLAITLESFSEVLKVYPDFRLYIGNPGHRQIEISLPEQAEILGPLPHHKIIQHLREAFCVFYPQHQKAETFGLIYAEANAVGTPVLGHDFGAASEVLSDSSQLVDGRDIKQVIEKLTEWRSHRPQLKGKIEFQLPQVISRWLEII